MIYKTTNNKIILIFIFFIAFITPTTSFSQSEIDTKEFIVEKFNENYSDLYSPSFMFFSHNILKVDAETFANRKLTDIEFKNLVCYGFDLEVGQYESEVLSFAETVDIRDITKVSTTKQDDNNFLVSVYLSGKFPSVRYLKNSNSQEVKIKEYLPKMKIQLGSNREAALQIKKAIIHLGNIKNISIKDGDLF
tara:strand:- start:956 stop:1531 length:576 start_codon:yes stop_codon:yes gene_type:complete